jgi:hypothetical protein
MESPHSDMLRSQPSLMNSGRIGAARTDHRKKIGSRLRKNCDPAAGTFSKEERRKRMKLTTKDQIEGMLHEMK